MSFHIVVFLSFFFSFQINQKDVNKFQLVCLSSIIKASLTNALRMQFRILHECKKNLNFLVSYLNLVIVLVFCTNLGYLAHGKSQNSN